eukprot:CAMPEP_0205870792 /NCGR_PEP_ID=MMETSP1083-20121108/10746_1 /ASSEMBLY_ACC=CAM_ASM_000430 /TAXON_ID=97485 /ORGANISM="Prymnesium parvum, Strain Texoma1" /LENGTH=232 /DNA_ID=CAMNT_0053233095 /DNA_START=508 /DNA_END=1203 /DNA_ORIENTATION=-
MIHEMNSAGAVTARLKYFNAVAVSPATSASIACTIADSRRLRRAVCVLAFSGHGAPSSTSTSDASAGSKCIVAWSMRANAAWCSRESISKHNSRAFACTAFTTQPAASTPTTSPWRSCSLPSRHACLMTFLLSPLMPISYSPRAEDDKLCRRSHRPLEEFNVVAVSPATSASIACIIAKSRRLRCAVCVLAVSGQGAPSSTSTSDAVRKEQVHNSRAFTCTAFTTQPAASTP